MQGVQGLCIMREDPQRIIDDYGIKKEEVAILSSRPFKDYETLGDLQSASRALSQFLETGEGVVLFDGLEYLISRFGFDSVYSFVQEKWFDFLESLTVQAAIAIDNASLFDELQHSNAELNLAYDTTIEGWSRALDLRDEGTEGHTERVTDMTEQLARAMGVEESQIVHIHRGALLHDMGKMGIPDSILLKRDALSREEWDIMRRHPLYAYEMLSPIIYLRKALDIPYCHHEKWDGTGYPRGLKGDQIPLAARIFAVVDVWDATTSDRPYRQAWTEEQTREYLLTQSGKHFDPQIIPVFLSILD